MRLLFNTKNPEILEIQLVRGKFIIDKTHLTVGQNLDIVLISTLDKILRKNRIERLSLKNVKIRGKMRPGAISSMILKTVAEAINY